MPKRGLKHGRKIKMLPAVMAAAAPHVARAVAGHAVKRGAAYMAGAGAAGAYALRKRRVVKKHDQPDTGVGAEFTKMRLSFGKPVKMRLPKLLQASIKAVTARVQWLSVFDNAASATTQPGGMGLNNFQAGAAGNTAYPLHLYDITSWMNTNQGTQVIAQPLYTMAADTNGNVLFANNSATWAIEQAADRSTDVAMLTRESDLLKSVSARFLFYGATAKPTRFCIDLISILDDSLQPDVVATGADTPENVNLYTGKSAFWNSIVRPYLWSPLNVGDPKATAGRKYKVHQHSEFVLQEKLTNEPSSFAGHMKQVDYTLHLDRLQRYDWNNKVLINPANATGGGAFAQEVNDLATVCTPKRRLYLMVRAQSTFTNGATVDPSKNPSYDLLLRAKHESVV